MTVDWLGRPPKPSLDRPGALLWDEIKARTQKYGLGVMASQIAQVAKPAVSVVGGVQVLEPMTPFMTRVGQVARTVGKWGTDIETTFSPLEPIKILIANPTNRFPGSSWERNANRAWYAQQAAVDRAASERAQLAAREQQNLQGQQRLLEEQEQRQRQQQENTRRQQLQQQQEQRLRQIRDDIRQRTFQLRPPSPSLSMGSLAMSGPMLAAQRDWIGPGSPRPLAPAPANTPFNLQLLPRTSQQQGNPFGLSLAGRPDSMLTRLNVMGGPPGSSLQLQLRP